MFLLGSIPYVASISVNKNVNKSVFKNFDNGWYLYTVDEGGNIPYFYGKKPGNFKVQSPMNKPK